MMPSARSGRLPPDFEPIKISDREDEQTAREHARSAPSQEELQRRNPGEASLIYSLTTVLNRNDIPR